MHICQLMLPQLMAPGFVYFTSHDQQLKKR